MMLYELHNYVDKKSQLVNHASFAYASFLLPKFGLACLDTNAWIIPDLTFEPPCSLFVHIPTLCYSLPALLKVIGAPQWSLLESLLLIRVYHWSWQLSSFTPVAFVIDLPPSRKANSFHLNLHSSLCCHHWDICSIQFRYLLGPSLISLTRYTHLIVKSFGYPVLRRH